MDELKACPFCGKSDIHIEQKGTFFWCECYDCGAISREHHTLPGVNVLQSEDFARGYWNQRPLEDALNARIAELEAEQRWIPVSERLPEDGEVVWLWDGNNLGMGYYLVLARQFMDRDTPLRQIKPTHWMSLPTPPEVK